MWFEWPEGCDALLRSASRSPSVMAVFGNVPFKDGFWEGDASAHGVHVRVPVRSSLAKGVISGAAVRSGAGWEVLGVEVEITEILDESRADDPLPPTLRAEPGLTPPRTLREAVGKRLDAMEGRWISDRYELVAESADAAALARTHDRARPTPATVVVRERP